MSTVNSIFFALTAVLLFGANSCQATVSCITCPMSIPIDITTDADLNTSGCILEDGDLCSLMLRIDYMNSNSSFALFNGAKDAGLILTNGEPEVSETTFVWFNEYRVQRLVQVACFSAASCGLDVVKRLYREKLRTFDYQGIQNKLVAQLYSSATPSSTLTCVDPSGASVSCDDGFCRSVLDGNGLVSYSSCVKKGAVTPPYGLVVTKTAMADFGGEQASIIYSCNKPMCNSHENNQQVLRQLVSAQILPQPSATTTTPPKSVATQLVNSQQRGLLLSFLTFFALWRFDH